MSQCTSYTTCIWDGNGREAQDPYQLLKSSTSEVKQTDPWHTYPAAGALQNSPLPVLPSCSYCSPPSWPSAPQAGRAPGLCPHTPLGSHWKRLCTIHEWRHGTHNSHTHPRILACRRTREIGCIVDVAQSLTGFLKPPCDPEVESGDNDLSSSSGEGLSWWSGAGEAMV